MEIEGARIAPNWTSAAGALEGVLRLMGLPLPRHAVMGLSGHAWHFCLQTREGVTALPGGPTDYDRATLARWYGRTGLDWERFSARAVPGPQGESARGEAVSWATAHLDAGRPLIGWDFHLHEHAVVYGYDAGAAAFLVDDLLTGDLGPAVPWADWPSGLGDIELLAPAGVLELDPVDTVAGALCAAVECFAGRDGPADGQPRGTAGLLAWAEAMDGDTEVDRAGNAYTLAVLVAARVDGAAFLADVAEALPDLAGPLAAAVSALREEATALSPLLTLFPFPSGGHGNVANPGLRRAAAMALRRAARHEQAAADALLQALALFD
ncbi:MAG: hypothetical protein HY875_01305 [Chloroflexi bacterium]|nr:hypothetical protein [Chloroflexota bacterium]